jgi:hypothetical protein
VAADGEVEGGDEEGGEGEAEEEEGDPASCRKGGGGGRLGEEEEERSVRVRTRVEERAAYVKAKTARSIRQIAHPPQ